MIQLAKGSAPAFSSEQFDLAFFSLGESTYETKHEVLQTPNSCRSQCTNHLRQYTNPELARLKSEDVRTNNQVTLFNVSPISSSGAQENSQTLVLLSCDYESENYLMTEESFEIQRSYSRSNPEWLTLAETWVIHQPNPAT